MKKLLIVAALALSASFVQAASVDWSGSGVATSTGVATETSSWTVTLMDSSKTSTSALAEAFASSDYTKISSAIALGKVDTTTIASLGTSFSKVSTIDDDAVGHKFYVLFTDTALADNSKGNYVVTAEKTVATTDLGSGNLAFDDLSTQTASWNVYATGTAAIPEPTSAMLLMLGMAGLALRRRARKA